MTDPKALEELDLASRAIERARALLAAEGNNATAAAVPFDPWQPISTAPKGMKVLLAYRNCLDKSRIVLGCFFEEGTLESSHEESGLAHPGWYEATEAYDELSPLDEDPTHWQPLPNPPGADANQQSKTGVTQAADSLARPSQSSLLAASPDDYWERIVAEIEAAGKQCRHALLLNHQAAHLLAWATISRNDAKETDQ